MSVSADVEASLTMPTHEDEHDPSSRSCKGSRFPGYVTVLSDGMWHCNRCGYVSEPTPEQRGTILDQHLRFEDFPEAKRRAAELTMLTMLAWTVQYHPETSRFHVVIPREQLHHVTPQGYSHP